MEDSMSSDKGMIATSFLSSSSPSASPSSSSSSSFSTNYPPPPQVAVISSPSISSDVPSSYGSSPNSPVNTIIVLQPEVISSPSSSRSVFPPSLSSTDSPPAVAAVVIRPCAACKILRRRCAENCMLAPYFPPSDPLKFTIVHRVFGASNIIKLLQELPESERANAVNSMLYEATVRLRDPVYGCAGAISQLKNQVNELQSQLARNATS